MADSGRDSASPAIRAVQTHAIVDVVEELPAAQRDDVLARVRPEVLDHARRSFGLAWFPMDEHMHLCGVVDQVIGTDAFRELFRRTFASSMQTAMLRGIFGMIRRVADDPGATLLRNAPRIYGYVTRDVGDVVANVEDRGNGTLELRGWPSAKWDYDVWLTGTQACIEGAFIRVGLEASAEVTVERRDAARGWAVYRVRW